MALKITKVTCPKEKYSIKCPYTMKPQFIVVHNTANKASAMNEISYMLRNDYTTSFHFAVDYERAVQGIDLNRNAWHASDGVNGKGNRYGIAIEICHSIGTAKDFEGSEKNGAILVAMLLKQYGWGIDKVKKHQDFTNKYCPHRTLDLGWQRFLNMVQAELDELNGIKPAPNVETYKLVVPCKVYTNADNAKNHRSPVNTYAAGTYYVFNKANGMINVTKTKGKAGGWINPSDNKKVEAPKLTPIELEAKASGCKVGNETTVKKGFYISKYATIYGGASYGVKIPNSIKQATTFYSCGGVMNKNGCWWVLANQISSWIKVKETLVR